MKNKPNKIYLQIGEERAEDYNELHEVTFHTEKIFDTDLEYVENPNQWLSVSDIESYCDGDGRLSDILVSVKTSEGLVFSFPALYENEKFLHLESKKIVTLNVEKLMPYPEDDNSVYRDTLVNEIKKKIKGMTNEQRANLMEEYCGYCGVELELTESGSCNCTNDI